MPSPDVASDPQGLPVPASCGAGAPGAGHYLPALDGVRAMAVLLVVVAHAGAERIVPGGLGVTAFFALSGFLITRQLLARHERDGRVFLGGFYLRRVLRLAPAALCYVLLAGGLFTLAGGHIPPLGWAAAAGQAANYFQLASGYRSDLLAVRHPFSILWSLSVEEHFYLIWPGMLCLLLATRGRAGLALAVCVLACLAAPLWRWWLFEHCFADPASHLAASGVRPLACLPPEPNPLFRFNRLYMATDTRFDSLAWGALAALAAACRSSLWRRLVASDAAFALALAGLAATLLPLGPAWREVWRYGLQGACLSLLVAALSLPCLVGIRSPDQAGGRLAAVGARLLSGTAPVLVGRLSYSLYLWHWGAFALADRLVARGSLPWLAVALPGAFVLAGVSYALVERPMLRWRRRAGSHAPLALHLRRSLEAARASEEYTGGGRTGRPGASPPSLHHPGTARPGSAPPDPARPGWPGQPGSRPSGPGQPGAPGQTSVSSAYSPARATPACEPVRPEVAAAAPQP